ncbi:MAG: hypothetical protein KC413_23825, partial [Anaerolineales bacterium]|nr:hypothetical protein [Anaerolineales bacterium]
MNEERVQILDMLARGKINATEAAKLLDALGQGVAETAVSTAETPYPSRIPRVPRVPRIPRIPRIPQRPLPPERPIHDLRRISPQYAAAMAQAGLPDLTQDDLWQMQIHHVTADYVRQLMKSG